MESGRFVLAVILMIAVIVVTNLLFPPAPMEPAAEAPVVEAPAGAGAATGTAGAGAVAQEAAAAPAVQLPEPSEPAVEADTVVVASPLYRYAISTRGAAVVGAELLRFESFTREGAVQLSGPEIDALLSYGVRVDGRPIDLRGLAFRPDAAGTVELGAGDAPRTVQFVHEDPRGFRIRIAYTFRPDSYVIGVEGRIEGIGGATPLLEVDLPPTLAVNEANPEEDYRSLAYAVRGDRNGIRSVQLDDVTEQRVEEGPLQWVAVRNKYFLVAAIRGAAETASDFGGLIANDAAQEHAAELTATLPVARDGGFDFRLYVGPQDYGRLAAINYELEDVNPYGWKIFRPILRPLAHLVIWAVVGLHETLNIGYGWVLILFGVLVRLALWPLNARAGRAQMKNMAIQPRIQEIQQKYKNNPERLQQEMLKLYREEGFNPLGGCLPMLIPFPVLITLFFVFQNTIEFRGAEFLWLPDLSRPDPLYILPILLGVSMFAMQRVTMKVAPPNQQAKMLMYVMPAFMVVLFFNLASGLNLYYAAQNLASIPQQIQLARERQRHQQARR
ncbi:MAG TPA: membrane protein insertase YidC [Longimicrobiales bacterium]